MQLHEEVAHPEEFNEKKWEAAIMREQGNGNRSPYRVVSLLDAIRCLIILAYSSFGKAVR